MILTRCWHSEAQGVHHLWHNCSEGKHVAADARRSGDGNRPLCPDCVLLERAAANVEQELRRALRLPTSTGASSARVLSSG
jgi:hypothetical protein